MAMTGEAQERPAAFDPAAMLAGARAASRFLKALSNQNRLLLLCLLAEGEKSVSELEAALGLRQPAISQQLARLRADELVAARRAGKSIHYSLASEEARRMMVLLYELFCQAGPKTDHGAEARGAPLRAAAGE
jgi:DNA-binding transcriptional ArsR family regulator